MLKAEHRSARMSKITNDRLPYNLYCVGADVKPCSVNQSINPVWHRMLYSFTHMTTVGIRGLPVIVVVLLSA